uniref:Dynamin-type G domain-containing protein n=1 Tax=Globodera rostochiensis TaxID=31243 RepID=A0A914I893_GLORO
MAANIVHLSASSAGDPKRRHLLNGNEPLQRFGEAKKWMADIYGQLDGHVGELHEFYSGMVRSDQKFVPPAQIDEIIRFRDSVRAIREVIGRDKMKVVFFGRTSNGKSSVINAMLACRVLPQGMGHTTCCFLQVEGGSEQDKYFMMEDGTERFPIAELDSVGHALGAEATRSLGRDSLIHIFYPKSASKLLQNDVLIVDSPGVDLSPEFDSWIDKHCLDADVFVLVSNSESTLTQAEKNFFVRVSKKLSRPNIFILCNRWDASASETEDSRAQIRAQHEQRFEDFLANELKVCSVQEAKNRYFFISAREMQDARLLEKGELMKTKGPYQQEGFQRRALEFKQFEEQFEKCISKSAIRTKFEAHNRRAHDIVEAIQHNLNTVHDLANQEQKRLALEFQLKTKEFANCRDNFKFFERTYYTEQHKLRSEVHMKVSADFLDEIGRLEAIIDRFKHSFVDDPELIGEYKRELAIHVNGVLSEELQNQCTGGLMAQIWSLEQSMHAFVKKILNERHAAQLDKIWQYKQPFKFAISINSPELMSDFHEDLEFRFSLGVENIARWILSITRGQPITSIDRNILRMNVLPRQQQNNGLRHGHQQQHLEKREVDAFLSNIVVQSASYLMNGSVGVTIAGLVVYKNVDWRWVLGGLGLVAGLYAFERLRWNNGAKEERLKTQFRQHLEQRLHQTESIHTSNCEQQVIHELDQVYEGLKTVVGGFHREMKEGIDQCKCQKDVLDGMVKSINTIKNKTNFVDSTLEEFTRRFLSQDALT